jgi:hypothetical protein
MERLEECMMLSALPDITRQVDIEGGTVSGTSQPLVTLSGGSAGFAAAGLTLGSGSWGSSIEDLVINGFDQDGIDIESTNDSVTGCYIGTNGDGTAAVRNSAYGIRMDEAGATIGGTTAGSANVISGNSEDGIYLDASCLVEGNLIGTDKTGANPVPNQGAGVYFAQGSAGAITIATPGARNIIAFNGGPGVATAPGTTGSTIRFNAIFGNTGPGIDFNDNGVTPNTPSGVNNTPVLTSVSDSSITGTLNAAPSSTDILDFYANLASDDSAMRPQGRDSLTSTTVTTDAAGTAVFNVSYTAFPGELEFTATATDARGTTSEFSPPRGLTALATFGQSPGFFAGTLYSAVVASLTDSSPLTVPGEFSATIDRGDGTTTTPGIIAISGGGFSVTCSHNYEADPITEPATFTVTTTITDARTGEIAVAIGTATVAPVPITTTPQNFAVSANKPFTGTVATFRDSDPRKDSSFYTATINWGDGTADTTAKITGSNPFTVKASHTFAPFPTTDLVTITITDQNGRTATAVDRVVDPPAPTTNPTPPSASAPTPAVLSIVADGLRLLPHRPFHGIVATFTESGPPEPASAYRATINWRKGRRSAGMIVRSNGRFVVTARHVFPRFKGARTVTVMVTDPAGESASVSESARYAAGHPKSIKVPLGRKSAVWSHR